MDIEKALQRQVIYGGDLATNLLELSIAREEEIAKYAGQAFGMPVLDLALLDAPEEKVVKMLPWNAANEHRMVPVSLEGDRMIVATSAPLQLGDLSEIAFLLGVEFAPHFVLEFRLAIALKRFFGIPIPDRFAALHKRLASEVSLEAPPVVVSPDEAPGLLREATGDRATEPVETEEAPAATSTPPASTAPMAAEGAEPDIALEPQPDESAKAAGTDARETPALAPAAPREDVAQEEDAEVTLDSPSEAEELPGESRTTSPEEIVIPKEARGRTDDRETIPSKLPSDVSAMVSATIDLEEAAEKLAAAEQRDEILRIFMERVGNVFEFAMLFVVQGKEAKGHFLVTDTTDLRRIEGPVLPVDAGGMLETAFNTHSIYLGSPGNSLPDQVVFQQMDRPRPKNCVILPVVLRGRVIMLLYGDSGAMGVKAGNVTDLSRLAHLVTEAFDRILLEKKYGKYHTRISMAPSKPAHMAFSKVPRPAVEDLESSAAAYRSTETELSGKMRADAVSKDAPTANWQSVAKAVEAAEEKPEEPPETKPEILPEAKPGKIIRKKKRSRERYDQTVPGGIKYHTLMDSAESSSDDPIVSAEEDTSSDSDLRDNEDAPKNEETKAGGEEPPVVEVKKEEQEKPRSVEVNMNEEIARLVERILSSNGKDTPALEMLMGIGEDAIEKLVEHFPGPLHYDRHQEPGKLLRVEKHGPLLQALTKFGRAAVPHLLPLFNSRDSDVRFYATFIFSELRYPEALDPLTARLFDPDRQIGAIATDVLRGFSSYPEFRWAMQKVVDVLAGPSRDLETKRIAARALGELGVALGIGTLIRMLDSVDAKLVKSCHGALVKITFTDFGLSRARWTEWYQSAGEGHRIEWAIEGLTYKDDAVRQSAFHNLKRLIGTMMEEEPLPEDLSQFEALQERLLTWWEDEGREIYQYNEGE